jgi:2'-5' RNA ligase
MRVFVGIKADEEIQKQILKWQEKFKNLPVRFIKPQNLHLTLLPPWYENNPDRLVKDLKKFNSEIKPFSITFEKIMTAPPNNPRLIWTEGPTVPELSKLREALAQYLKKSKGKRHFKPHITLARFKPQDFNFIGKIEENLEIKPSTVSTFTLFESTLSRSGAQYRTIEKFSINI